VAISPSAFTSSQQGYEFAVCKGRNFFYLRQRNSQAFDLIYRNLLQVLYTEGSSFEMHIELNRAKSEGYHIATLQASHEGKGLYEKLGFKKCCIFKEYAASLAYHSLN